MEIGLRIWDGASNLVYDSTTVKGGVIAGIYFSSPGAQTLNFPLFAGRTVDVITPFGIGDGSGITTSTANGYPQVNVPPSAPSFLVVVW